MFKNIIIFLDNAQSRALHINLHGVNEVICANVNDCIKSGSTYSLHKSFV